MNKISIYNRDEKYLKTYIGENLKVITLEKKHGIYQESEHGGNRRERAIAYIPFSCIVEFVDNIDKVENGCDVYIKKF